MPAQLMSSAGADLSAEPILAAVDAYRGTIVDLERSLTVGPAELAAGRKSLEAAFATQGLHPGDRLIFAVGNGPLFPAALAAILAAGGTPLLVHFETPVAELKRLATAHGARFIVSDAAEQAALRAAGLTTSVLGDSWHQVRWAELDADDPSFEPPVLSLPGVPLHPTSGSTGVSKIAARPGFCAMEEARHYIQTLGLDASDVVAAIPPMSHAYGYGMCTMVPLLTGADLITLRGFKPALVLRAAAEFRVTVMPAVPVMLDRLMLDADALRGMVRHVLSAGAPLTERTAHEFSRRTGAVVRSLYGTTETGGISIASATETAPHAGVGRPMDGVEAEIQPLEGASHLGQGVGQVCVKSSSMMLGYVTRSELLTESIPAGWFVTGDLGRLSPSGAIQLVGRASDVINVSGLKVVPSDVEDVLSELPGVKEVKVYAGKRRDGSQFVKAAIFAPELNLDLVQTYCHEQFVYYKRPEEIVMLEQPLPRTAAGKILKANLP